MSKLIDGLVTRELIERGPEAGDRRRVALSLTADGKALLALVHDDTQSYLSTLLGGLSAAERAAIVDAMELVSPLFSVPKST
jgi:DNA-binding MarR family transcriptional regulator